MLFRSAGVAALTFIAEAVGIGLAFNVSPLMVLQTAFEFDLDMIRPGWLVLGVGVLATAVDVAGARLVRPRPALRKPAPVGAGHAGEVA